MVGIIDYFQYYQVDNLYSVISILALEHFMVDIIDYSQYLAEPNFQVVEINFTFNQEADNFQAIASNLALDLVMMADTIDYFQY